MPRSLPDLPGSYAESQGKPDTDVDMTDTDDCLIPPKPQPTDRDAEAQALKELPNHRGKEFAQLELEFNEFRRTAPDPETVRSLETELKNEQARRAKTEEDLRHKSTEAKENLKRWRQTARELNDLRSQTQPHYIVTDEYLKDLALNLRYNIRTFAIQHFGGELSKKLRWEKTGCWDTYMAPIKGCEKYLASAERSHSIIQAFIWGVIRGRIFDKFRWAGGSASPVRGLCLLLRPG